MTRILSPKELGDLLIAVEGQMVARMERATRELPVGDELARLDRVGTVAMNSFTRFNMSLGRCIQETDQAHDGPRPPSRTAGNVVSLRPGRRHPKGGRR